MKYPCIPAARAIATTYAGHPQGRCSPDIIWLCAANSSYCIAGTRMEKIRIIIFFTSIQNMIILLSTCILISHLCTYIQRFDRLHGLIRIFLMAIHYPHKYQFIIQKDTAWNNAMAYSKCIWQDSKDWLLTARKLTRLLSSNSNINGVNFWIDSQILERWLSSLTQSKFLFL